MSIESTTERTYHIKATCDNCGTVKTWDQPGSPEALLDLGFDMTMVLGGDMKYLWFHEAACVHAFVTANVIEHLRHPEGVAA